MSTPQNNRYCRHFLKGGCTHSGCKFLHMYPPDSPPTPVKSNNESHQRTPKSTSTGSKICHQYAQGKCGRGNACKFAHSGANNTNDSPNKPLGRGQPITSQPTHSLNNSASSPAHFLSTSVNGSTHDLDSPSKKNNTNSSNSNSTLVDEKKERKDTKKLYWFLSSVEDLNDQHKLRKLLWEAQKLDGNELLNELGTPLCFTSVLMSR